MLSLSTIEDYPKFKESTLKSLKALKDQEFKGLVKDKDDRLKVSMDSTYQAAIDIQMNRFSLADIPLPWKVSLEVFGSTTTWEYRFQPDVLSGDHQELEAFISDLKSFSFNKVTVDKRKSILTIESEIQGADSLKKGEPLKYTSKSKSDKVFIPNTLIWSHLKKINGRVWEDVKRFVNSELEGKEKFTDKEAIFSSNGFSPIIILPVHKLRKLGKDFYQKLIDNITSTLEGSRLGSDLNIVTKAGSMSIYLNPMTFKKTKKLAEESFDFEYAKRDEIEDKLQSQEIEQVLDNVKDSVSLSDNNNTSRETALIMEAINELTKQHLLLKGDDEVSEVIKEVNPDPYLEDDKFIKDMLKLSPNEALSYISELEKNYKGKIYKNLPVGIKEEELAESRDTAEFERNPERYLRDLKQDTLFIKKTLEYGKTKEEKKKDEEKNKTRGKERLDTRKDNIKKNIEIRDEEEKRLEDPSFRDDGKVFDETKGMYLPNKDLKGTPYENLGNNLELVT